MSDRDWSRTIAHAWFLRESTGDIDWWMISMTVGIVILTLPSRVTEGWIFIYVFGLAIMSAWRDTAWRGGTGAPRQLVIIIILLDYRAKLRRERLWCIRGESDHLVTRMHSKQFSFWQFFEAELWVTSSALSAQIVPKKPRPKGQHCWILPWRQTT